MSTNLRHLIACLLIDLFLSNSTLYLGTISINISVTWNLQLSMADYLVFDWGFSSLAPSWMILLVSNDNILLTLTRLYYASWRPSSLSVSILASNNSFHHWLVIRQFLTCSTSTPLFTCTEICCLDKEMTKTLANGLHHLALFPLPRCIYCFRRQIIRMIILWHSSTFHILFSETDHQDDHIMTQFHIVLINGHDPSFQKSLWYRY